MSGYAIKVGPAHGWAIVGAVVSETEKTVTVQEFWLGRPTRASIRWKSIEVIARFSDLESAKKATEAAETTWKSHDAAVTNARMALEIARSNQYNAWISAIKESQP